MIYINKNSGAFQDLNKKDFEKLSDSIKSQYREATEKEVEIFKTKKSAAKIKAEKRKKAIDAKENKSVVKADSKQDEKSESTADASSEEE